MSTVASLREALNEFPDDWEVEATKSGRSILVAPRGEVTVGTKWAYVLLTTPPSIQWQTRRKKSIFNYP
jgi:hypothetical protein